jgi:hypothetical protein
LEGKRLAEPLPAWLEECHETYLIGQACPWWTPPDEECSDFKLRVMARIHQTHLNERDRRQAEQLRGMAGG